MKGVLKKIIRAVRASDKLMILAPGLVLSIMVGFLYDANPQFLQIMDMKLYDQLLIRTHTTKTTGIPVVVDLDEKSLAENGQWPWPRFRVALLMAKIAEAGAAAVGMDILFSEPDRTSPRRLQKDVRTDLQVDMGFVGLPEGLEDFDKVFAGVLATGPYALSCYFDFHPGEKPSREECLIKPLQVALLRKAQDPTPEQALLNPYDAVCPLPVLAAAAPITGFFNAAPDEDGILRSVPLVISWKGQTYPSLALATLLQAQKSDKIAMRMNQNGVESISLGRGSVPVDRSGRLFVKFRGPQRTFPYYSAADVLSGKVGEKELKGKIVFIGTSASGLMDIRATPLDSIYPGVETHCNIVDNILSNDFLTRPKEAQVMEGLATVVCGLLITIIMAWARAIWALVPVGAMAVGLWEGAAWFMGSQSMIVSPLYPLIAVAANFTLLTLIKFWREEGQKKFLHATFASYLSPELIKGMVDSKTMPELGGEARTISAYFTDIQGFSSFSEILTAHQLVELLNEYLSAMTDILMLEKGTLDKYIGDAIVAFFGAPIELPDHALRAAKTALAMQDKLTELRGKWAAEATPAGKPERNVQGLPVEKWPAGAKWPVLVHHMRMRIGLNTGEIVVGNMGSSMRMNYTMMGDSVNLAARLEAASKQYGVFILVSEFILDADVPTEGGTVKLRDLVEVRFIDKVTVVGKALPVSVYELCAMKGQLSDQDRTLRERFDQAMGLYQDMRWDEAEAAFARAEEVERFPDAKTTPSRVFRERCQAFREHPPVAPGEKWDGVYRMTKK